MSSAVTRTVDARGRLTLGPEFARQLVIIRREDDGSLTIIPAEAVPAREAWLYRNGEAAESVARGLEEAREGRFAEPPDLEADERLVEDAEDAGD